MIIDLFLVYQFIRRLATPFNEWEAYKLGIIDEKGNVLKKRRDLTTIKDRDAFGIFDVMILNLKKLLAKIPGGSSRIASYAAALYLIREWNHFSDSSILTEEISDEEILESLDSFYDRYVNYINEMNDVNKKSELNRLFEEKVLEDVPAVNVGSGNIAGLGVGPQGEPGLTRRQMLRYKGKNKSSKPRKILNAFEDTEAQGTYRATLAPHELTKQTGKIRRNIKHTRPAAVPSQRLT
jgi:hypothetical protein